jgi:hypothetical protein
MPQEGKQFAAGGQEPRHRYRLWVYEDLLALSLLGLSLLFHGIFSLQVVAGATFR